MGGLLDFRDTDKETRNTVRTGREVYPDLYREVPSGPQEALHTGGLLDFKGIDIATRNTVRMGREVYPDLYREAPSGPQEALHTGGLLDFKGIDIETRNTVRTGREVYPDLYREVPSAPQGHFSRSGFLHYAPGLLLLCSPLSCDRKNAALTNAFVFMTIQYASDLHLEFKDNKRWLRYHPLVPKGDILLLAGDIDVLGPHYFKHPYLKKVSQQFAQVYIIPGNHEYYSGYDVALTIDPYYRSIYPNVHLVNNIRIDLGEAELIATTLWSRIEKYPLEVGFGMQDFRQIYYHGRIISVQDYNDLFDRCWSFLRAELQQSSDKPRIVMTHHLPSAACNAAEFIGSTLNEGFCTDLSNEIKSSRPNYWIYGHSHRNIAPFTLGATQMLTNQLGYVRWREVEGFRADAVFTL